MVLVPRAGFESAIRPMLFFGIVNPVFSFTHVVGCSPRLSYLGLGRFHGYSAIKSFLAESHLMNVRSALFSEGF